MADLYTHAQQPGPMGRPPSSPLSPPFFSRLQFNTQIGSRDNATGPRKQPLSLPFPHTHAHASRGSRGATGGEYQKGTDSGVRRSILFPPSLDRVFDSFSGTHSPSSLRDGRGTIAWKSVSPPPPPFCSVENFPSFLLLSFFFRMDFQSKSSRLISLWGNQLRDRK